MDNDLHIDCTRGDLHIGGCHMDNTCRFSIFARRAPHCESDFRDTVVVRLRSDYGAELSDAVLCVTPETIRAIANELLELAKAT